MKPKAFGLKTTYQKEQQQTQLKKEYGIADKNVVVVERKSRVVLLWKNTLQFLLFLLRLAAAIALIVLAIIGLCALIYPAPRAALANVFTETMVQIHTFTGL